MANDEIRMTNEKGPAPGGQVFLPRLIAWEVTRSCPLACRHCRAAARNEPYEGELSTDEGRRLLENIEKKLANANFTGKAPAEVVDRERARAQDARAAIAALAQRAAELG